MPTNHHELPELKKLRLVANAREAIAQQRASQPAGDILAKLEQLGAEIERARADLRKLARDQETLKTTLAVRSLTTMPAPPITSTLTKGNSQ